MRKDPSPNIELPQLSKRISTPEAVSRQEQKVELFLSFPKTDKFVLRKSHALEHILLAQEKGVHEKDI